MKPFSLLIGMSILSVWAAAAMQDVERNDGAQQKGALHTAKLIRAQTSEKPFNWISFGSFGQGADGVGIPAVRILRWPESHSSASESPKRAVLTAQSVSTHQNS